MQNLFVKLFENDALDNADNVEAYLLRAVKYKCIDFLRRAKTDRENGPTPFGVEQADYIYEIGEEDIEPLFYYYTAKLPPKTRSVFLMSREGGLTYREIAENLAISVKTVEKQMSRALSKLREFLKEQHLWLPF